MIFDSAVLRILNPIVRLKRSSVSCPIPWAFPSAIKSRVIEPVVTAIPAMRKWEREECMDLVGGWTGGPVGGDVKLTSGVGLENTKGKH